MVDVAQPFVVGPVAAVEVIVVVLRDEAVEAVDRGAQVRRFDVQQARQFLDGVGFLEEARVIPFLRLFRSS